MLMHAAGVGLAKIAEDLQLDRVLCQDDAYRMRR